ncbi:MarR family transcriptional regulator [Comamonas thiooxydans]|uniref:MarR family winged helix-turn-helix transcriptional regulator n=1 Tax=Comamonas thiooxydans TaxID=363952 RepID=UPI0024475A6E|nr:MarR family transcriptional regulator [Comamonas thiooxydans]MDH1477004.1 MarR family transcriptional regulator [Comamonas thiooxydans]
MKKKRSARPLYAVDVVIGQWAQERPDLDASPMGPIERIKRCAALLGQSLEENFAQFGLSLWEFDMLATLRRSGAPYCLSPTELFSMLMVTSGTMTHRLKRLEASGLIQRIPNSQDARSMLVQLTAKGLKLIDDAVEAHIEKERELMSRLPRDVLAQLNTHLSALLLTLEPSPSSGRADAVGE